MQSPQGIIALTYISGSIMKKCNFTFKILSLSVIQVATLRINAPNISCLANSVLFSLKSHYNDFSLESRQIQFETILSFLESSFIVFILKYMYKLLMKLLVPAIVWLLKTTQLHISDHICSACIFSSSHFDSTFSLLDPYYSLS